MSAYRGSVVVSSVEMGRVLFLDVLRIRALLFGVFFEAPHFWKLFYELLLILRIPRQYKGWTWGYQVH